jgi:hypothetical protein
MGWKTPLRLLLWVCRLFLVFAMTYWTLLVLVLVVPFAQHGLRGVEGKLMHVTMMGIPFDERSWEKTILHIHKMWETQFFMLALTWLAFSVHRHVRGALSRGLVAADLSRTKLD